MIYRLRSYLANLDFPNGTVRIIDLEGNRSAMFDSLEIHFYSVIVANRSLHLPLIRRIDLLNDTSAFHDKPQIRALSIHSSIECTQNAIPSNSRIIESHAC